jgi:hypothetical protein
MMGIIADFWGVFSQRNINKASKADEIKGKPGRRFAKVDTFSLL